MKLKKAVIKKSKSVSVLTAELHEAMQSTITGMLNHSSEPLYANADGIKQLQNAAQQVLEQRSFETGDDTYAKCTVHVDFDAKTNALNLTIHPPWEPPPWDVTFKAVDWKDTENG